MFVCVNNYADVQEHRTRAEDKHYKHAKMLTHAQTQRAEVVRET